MNDVKLLIFEDLFGRRNTYQIPIQVDPEQAACDLSYHTGCPHKYIGPENEE